MSQNVIHLLPDAVANQIAAGEVIQRPASIVKELVENSIDAGALAVRVVIRDAGRTLVQVIDDGCGMSETDARMAFERHATSKISEATDLYQLCTMGFRGEALASIAAVAQVDLLTRREGDELGLKLSISGSRVVGQEPIATPKGTQMCVRNLFFNIPARRRFLKNDNTEMRHINIEFLRVALAHPNVALSLTNNGLPAYNFAAGNLKQRVAAVAGKALAQNLLPIESETSLVRIRGFIGSPQTAKKTGGDQYFFANNRFMKHAYMHKAVVDAYKNIISPDLTPAYFIYLEVDPQTLDVNIHPQKTEIKFENDSAIWQILNATVRECLGHYNIMPSIDFENDKSIDIPVYREGMGSTWSPEQLDNLGGYNPFEHEEGAVGSQSFAVGKGSGGCGGGMLTSRANVQGWQQLYQGLENEQQGSISLPSGASAPDSLSANGEILNSQITPLMPEQPEIFASAMDETAMVQGEHFIQLRGKYIVTQVQSGLMIIDQHRAHERILYEQIEKQVNSGSCPCQQLLFDEIMPLGSEDACIVEEMSDELRRAGLETRYDIAEGHLHITTIPAIIEAAEVQPLIETLLYDFREGEVNVSGGIMNYVVRTLAQQSAIGYGKTLSADEMQTIFNQLFATASPSLSPTGKTVFAIMKLIDVEQLLK